jgi:heme/copper-type cytochrome/quinol oxidase subunit 4
MRKALSIILNVFAGFLFYGAILLGFIEANAFKWGIIGFFLVIAAIPLAISMVLTRFRQWRKATGVVLMSASGFTAFLIFSFACMYMSEESRKFMSPDIWEKFSDYPTGFGLMLAFAVIGFVLFKSDTGSAVFQTSTDSESI